MLVEGEAKLTMYQSKLDRILYLDVVFSKENPASQNILAMGVDNKGKFAIELID